MRRLSWALILLFVGFMLLFGFVSWRIHVQQQKLGSSLLAAEQALRERRPEEAYQLALTSESGTTGQTYLRWQEIKIAALAQKNDAAGLAKLYAKNPQAFARYPQALTKVGHLYLAAEQWDRVHKLVNRWQQQGDVVPEWVILQVDAFVGEGKRDEAIEQLQANRFQGRAEAMRLSRLAYLMANKDPREADRLMQKAEMADPTDPDIVIYRLKIQKETADQ